METSEDVKELNIKLEKIKKKNWIKSKQKGAGAAGVTLEKELGLTENEFEIPDYKSIEIKTKKINSAYYTTLFNASPIGPSFYEVNRIKNRYGWYSRTCKNKKIFNASISANRISIIGKKWKMTLHINDEKGYIILYISDLHDNIIEKKTFWTYEQLKEKLIRKLSTLALIEYNKKELNNNEYFQYEKITFYKLTNFKNFIELLKTGEIRISFKVGIYNYGIKKGQIFNHGTGFEIKRESIEKLFEKIEI